VKIKHKGKTQPEKTSCGYNNNNIKMYLKSTGYAPNIRENMKS
jgi:hypothetical protein